MFIKEFIKFINKKTYIDIPVSGYMPENFYVEKDGRTYVYNSTSVYDAGTKRKKTVTTYIGRLDPETGKIISKKERSPSKEFIDPDKMRALKFGGSYALLGLAENIGLRDDVFSSFGSDSEKVLASAIMQVLAGGPMSSVEDVADGSIIRELMGISERFTSPRMSELTKRMGEAYGNIEELFEKRVRRVKGVLGYDITSVSTYSDLDGWGERGHNRDGEKLKQMNLGLVTDKKGVPVMFETYPGSVSDVRTLERTVERIDGYGADSLVMVLDRGFGSAANLSHMLNNGISFVIPGKSGTKCIKSLITSLIKEKGVPDSIRIHDGKVYAVIETHVAVVPKGTTSDVDEEDSNDTRDLELITSNDERFFSVPEEKRMKAFVCHNEGRGAVDNEKLHAALAGIEEKLKKMDPWAAVREQKRTAGGYSKFIECRVENNELVVERKRNSLSFAMNRSGMFVMLSSGVEDWGDMMSCYDCRTYVEQSFDVLKNELDGNRWRTDDPITAKGRMLIKFVALILWCTIASILRSEKNNTPVTSFIQSLDNIMAVGNDNIWRLTEVTKKNRKAFELLGLEEPKKRYTLKEHDHIPRSLIEQVMYQD